RFIQAIISMENRLITYLRMNDVFPALISEAA
ncbi:MAG TPA: chemotaxis protein CheW, partial [Caulobacter sp.]|nr:chemotaxis protein CheW [Caulobacter sp.]